MVRLKPRDEIKRSLPATDAGEDFFVNKRLLRWNVYKITPKRLAITKQTILTYEVIL